MRHAPPPAPLPLLVVSAPGYTGRSEDRDVREGLPGGTPPIHGSSLQVQAGRVSSTGPACFLIRSPASYACLPLYTLMTVRRASVICQVLS